MDVDVKTELIFMVLIRLSLNNLVQITTSFFHYKS